MHDFQEEAFEGDAVGFLALAVDQSHRDIYVRAAGVGMDATIEIEPPLFVRVAE